MMAPQQPRREQATSGDGTTVGFHALGHGPALVLIPGALHSSHHYTTLSRHLSGSFTVLSLDRRGRPGSAPQRPDHGIEAECQDVIAILEQTEASIVFGHSSGGVVALQSALRFPVERVAVYEPPVSVWGSVRTGFLTDLEAALARGQKGDALAILAKGLESDPRIARIPLWALRPLMRLARKGAKGEEADIFDAVSSFPAEGRMIAALDSEADRYRAVACETLIMIGDRPPGYLMAAAFFLSGAIPSSRLIRLKGLNHDAPDDEDPTQASVIAAELRQFYLN